MWHFQDPGCPLNILRLRSHRFLIFFEGEDSEIDLQQPEPEFSEYKWVDINEIPLHVCSDPSLTPSHSPLPRIPTSKPGPYPL